jgi:hypothetical protein
MSPLMGPTPPILDILNNSQVLMPVLYMGILGTPIAMSLLLYGQSKIEASEASLFTYLQPLVYIPLCRYYGSVTPSPFPQLARSTHVLPLGVIAEQSKQA